MFNSCSDPVTFGYVLLGTFWDKLILSANWAHYDFFPVFGFPIIYLFIYFFYHALNRANKPKKKKKEREQKHTHTEKKRSLYEFVKKSDLNSQNKTMKLESNKKTNNINNFIKRRIIQSVSIKRSKRFRVPFGQFKVIKCTAEQWIKDWLSVSQN